MNTLSQAYDRVFTDGGAFSQDDASDAVKQNSLKRVAELEKRALLKPSAGTSLVDGKELEKALGKHKCMKATGSTIIAVGDNPGEMLEEAGDGKVLTKIILGNQESLLGQKKGPTEIFVVAGVSEGSLLGYFYYEGVGVGTCASLGEENVDVVCVGVLVSKSTWKANNGTSMPTVLAVVSLLSDIYPVAQVPTLYVVTPSALKEPRKEVATILQKPIIGIVAMQCLRYLEAQPGRVLVGLAAGALAPRNGAQRSRSKGTSYAEESAEKARKEKLVKQQQAQERQVALAASAKASKATTSPTNLKVAGKPKATKPGKGRGSKGKGSSAAAQKGAKRRRTSKAPQKPNSVSAASSAATSGSASSSVASREVPPVLMTAELQAELHQRREWAELQRLRHTQESSATGSLAVLGSGMRVDAVTLNAARLAAARAAAQVDPNVHNSHDHQAQLAQLAQLRQAEIQGQRQGAMMAMQFLRGGGGGGGGSSRGLGGFPSMGGGGGAALGAAGFPGMGNGGGAALGGFPGMGGGFGWQF